MDLSETTHGRPAQDPAGRRQRILNRLMILALEGVDLPDLEREAAEQVAGTLGVELACVMKLLPGQDRLILKTGVGWNESCVGRTTVEVGMASRAGYVSQAGYTLIADWPVAVCDLDLEPRFEGCQLLKRHRVRAGVTARISTASGPYGIVGAHSREPRAFSPDEAEWVGDVARVLGAAASRHTDGGTELLRLREVGERYEALRDVLNLAASAPDPLSSLDAVASVAVASLADWCMVDLLDDDGTPGYTEGDTIRRVVVRAAPGAGGEDVARQISQCYPLDPCAPVGTPRVLTRQRPVVETSLTDRLLRAASNGPDRLETMRRLNPTSYIGLPLMVRARTRGAILLIATGERRLEHGHLPVAEGLAACASLVLSGFLTGVTPGREQEEIARIARSGTAVTAPGPEGGLQAALGVTPRQAEIVAMLGRPMAPKEIASELNLSLSTVKTHIERACRGLGVRTYKEAVREARRRGIIGA